MKVLVDTTAWSLALRRRAKDLGSADRRIVDELTRLIDESRAVLVGPIRQEVLSGIPDKKQFERVAELLEPFDDLPLERTTYENAAELFNACRKKGVQGSHVDFLICAAAISNGAAVFSTDKDFQRYAKHSRVSLHRVRKGK